MSERIATVGRRLILVSLLILLAACGEPEPIRVGFVGGLSGRYFAVGVGSRNGAGLAVERANAAGGINGRPIELLIRDDAQDADIARAVVADLINQDVAAIIGPATSEMTVAVKSLADESETLLVVTTVSSSALSGLDDQVLKLMPTNQVSAGCLAQFLLARSEMTRFAAVHDDRNLAFSVDWLDEFSARLGSGPAALGQRVVFPSGAIEDLGPILDQVLVNDPELIVLISDFVDAAVLIKEIRRRASDTVVAMPEHAQVMRLMELAGSDLDGVLTPINFDVDDASPAYQSFRAAYRQRFGQDPEYPALAGFDAASLVIRGLRDQRDDRSLKVTLLEIGRLDGVQGTIRFNRFGDPDGAPKIARVKDGAYVVEDMQCEVSG